jgi:hypothetical protein
MHAWLTHRRTSRWIVIARFDALEATSLARADSAQAFELDAFRLFQHTFISKH